MANLTAAESISTRHTLLVANRGEIAVRIIRTAKRMGIRTIGVYTPADAISPHVTLADLAIALPNPPPPDSIDLSDSNLATKVKASTTTTTTEGTAYLIPEPFIEICKKHDVTLLHPGYGFLSENAEFAEMVINAGVVWLGPKPNVIRNMGLKHEARKIVKDVAVADGSDGELVVGRSELALKVVPGSEGLVKDAEEAKEVVRGIGLPVLFKASAGGGGLGMIVCEMIEDVEGAFENATRRAESLFGYSGIFVETYFSRARHIEIQVFGDGEGNVIHLGERECSIQRRHQKVIEESPSPFLEGRPDIRGKMCDAAVTLCRSIQYESAGTVEFLVDDLTGEFYFLEMNTRIQVEHPVTEVVHSNLDLVEMMIKHGIAKHDRKQSPIDFNQSTYDKLRETARDAGRGYAVEARVYAENPAEEFRPCPGLLQNVQLEERHEWLRVDTWISTGVQITPHFDPLLAKIIVHGGTRQEAISRLLSSLEESKIQGPPNNVEYLRAIVSSAEYQSGQTTTRFLDNFRYEPCAMQVVSSGLEMTIQDLPGRTIGKGIPCSGPMDPISFSIGNFIVANEKETEGIEIIVIPGVPACFRFLCRSEIAITGREVTVLVNEVEHNVWSRLIIPPGGVVRIMAKQGGEGGGLRTYLLVRGGFPGVPLYLGSKSTSVSIGGYQGRPLMASDFLALSEIHSKSLDHPPYALPRDLVPHFPTNWIIYVLSGPHDDEEFVTKDGIANFYSTHWQVSPSSNRMGIRLQSAEKIHWARVDGGEGGAHPSNILDTGYALGSVNVNGDTPVLLTNEGPDMGGYVCLCTVATGELWKLGQLSPGSTVQFRRISHDTAVKIRDNNSRYLSAVKDLVLGQAVGHQASLFLDDLNDRCYSPRLAQNERVGEEESLVLRQAGDSAVLAEFGSMKLDFLVRVRVQVFLEGLKARNILGLKRLSPCIRSIMVYYDPHRITQSRLVEEMLLANEKIPDMLSDITFPARRLTFPIVLNDPWSQEATKRYVQTIRANAVYLPSNLEYLARNNGLSGTAAALEKLVSTDWIVFGVGFYLACPFLVPMDPRSRLMGQKLNPSRTFTPRGAVGIAGSVAAIYPIESPGGYQLFGRSLPAWQTWGRGKNFTPENPWLLEPFDQLRFEPVDISTYEESEKSFEQGSYVFKMEPTALSVEQYITSLSTIEGEIITFRERQQVANADGAERERILLLEWEHKGLSRENHSNSSITGDSSDCDAKPITITATLFASIWKISCTIGETLTSTERPLLVLEAMKSEVIVKPDPEHIGRVVKALGPGIRHGALVKPGDVLVIL